MTAAICFRDINTTADSFKFVDFENELKLTDYCDIPYMRKGYI
jgi:hypothetical protein